MEKQVRRVFLRQQLIVINLPHFQKDPKNCTVALLACASCIAMHAGKHPDFIEIDAASNTGVDNVRQIIDSSALVAINGA